MRLSIFKLGIIFTLAISLSAAAPQGSSISDPDKSTEAARVNNLGAAYMNQQLFEKAVKAFQDAYALDPKLRIARVNQGIALLNLAKIDAARDVFERAVKENPEDAFAWYNFGLLYKNSGDGQKAAECFRQVTEIDPNDADSWYFLGAAYAENKQYSEAMDAFQHALKLNPQHASAEFGLARGYQQVGDSPQAREHLQRFQHIKDAKLGQPISLAYGEQGKYSLAEEAAASDEKVPAQISVKFVDVTKDAGLASKPKSSDAQTSDNPLGPGACFLDFDNDGRIDLFLPNNGHEGGISLYHNVGNGKFEDITLKAGLNPKISASSCTSGDYDNDGFTDLAASFHGGMLLLRNEKNGTFRDMAALAGIKAVGIDGLAFVDYDHDGDLDLYGAGGMLMIAGAARSGNSVMWRNNGDSTFTNVTGDIGTSLPAEASNAIGTDYNNDRAVDIVEADSLGGTVFQNPREGKFIVLHPFSDAKTDVRGSTSSIPEVSATAGIGILDFDHDGWMDVAFTHWGPLGLTLWRNNHGKNFEPVTLPAINWVRGYGVAAIDYDNDGWVDLVAVGETAEGKGEVRLFRNLGPEGFKDVTADVGLDKIQLKDPRAVITGDFDNDGATDLLITQNKGPAVLLRNEGGNQNHWLRLNLKGLADNKSAIGTKVEVFAGGNRQKFEIAGSSGYLGQNSPYLTVGLGRAKQADIVRMLWPTGVLQDEVEVAADREQKFLELDRRGSSCPTLFMWDGKSYSLVADMLGAGVVGHWIALGERDIPRPTEYVKVNRQSVHKKDGKLSFRFMEPLEESVYLDQVELLAVDHPREVEVYPNEYFASHPPYAPFKVVFSKNAQPPAAAIDEHAHDVLPDLLAHRYFGDFEVLSFAGFTKLHSLELDLGKPYDGGALWLLMHGEVEYFSATSMYAADQSGLRPIAPYLEVLDSQGEWAHVMGDMGFPAGGPRTITVDLSEKLPRGTQRIRISTNLQIYWDNILIDRTPQKQPAHINEVPLVRADLDFRGFPLKIEDKPPGNVKYIYEKASATGPYTRPAGSYTRYGDVLPLVTSIDDKLAVFGSGDEVALDFDPSRLPPMPQGWARDYFFAAHGYEKDMDFYAYDFDDVEPLPFQSMGSYPYPGRSFPLDEDHLKYLLEYNTRYMSGHEATGYSFGYPSK
jgi:tetratricopeptide (TPR) repeat protein